MLLSYKDITTSPKDIIEYFLDRTDLNRENYTGITASHLIFGRGIWKKFKRQLSGKYIDLLKTDDNRLNCYGYIDELDKTEFLEFIESLKKTPIKTSIEDYSPHTANMSVQNILALSIEDAKISERHKNNQNNTQCKHSKKNRNYGLFNSNTVHYMLYLRYLENKHRNMFIPIQPYNRKNIKNDIFFENVVSSYVTFNEQEKMVKHVKIYRNLFYSYLPHTICWIDDDCYYQHHNLQKILIDHNKNIDAMTQRFVVIKISIVISQPVMHANILIYDRQQKKAWRFEPYGTNRVTYKPSMDKIMEELLRSVYGDIEYNDPNSFLRNINFQTVDNEDNAAARNIGDPGGYCLAWCLWFVDTVLSHPEISPRSLVKHFSRDIVSDIISEEEVGHKIRSSNYYLDFIRRYARKLDDEKNIILDELGVKRYHMYKTVMNPEIRKLITDMFKIKSD
jgi:DNA-directed RNA polymerase subunit N (RpoN/RPB10)